MLQSLKPSGSKRMNGDTELWTSHVDAGRGEEVATSYARRQGLSLPSLFYWRRKLNVAAEASAGGGTGKFVALHLVTSKVLYWHRNGFFP
jgi:hypothetical protein